uniref:HDC09441 n=1 Tax=Drosophila melanogaster TaxID=7227 RepID=Q6ILH5_DROME|nr:TPA_inf: HDC09441 [Drosophila melanogaster]
MAQMCSIRITVCQKWKIEFNVHCNITCALQRLDLCESGVGNVGVVTLTTTFMGITHAAASERKQLEEKPHITHSTTGVLNMPFKCTCNGSLLLTDLSDSHLSQRANCIHQNVGGTSIVSSLEKWKLTWQATNLLTTLPKKDERSAELSHKSFYTSPTEQVGCLAFYSSPFLQFPNLLHFAVSSLHDFHTSGLPGS